MPSSQGVVGALLVVISGYIVLWPRTKQIVLSEADEIDVVEETYRA